MRIRTRTSLVTVGANPVPKRDRRGPRDYPYDDKIKCIALYASEMSLQEISTTTRIPLSTLKTWRAAVWWDDELRKIRAENEELYRMRAHKIIDKTTKAVIDRLDNGDHFVNNRGEVVRVPVKAKDAAIIGAVFMDKLRISLNLPTQIHGTADGDRLLKLAERFAQIAGSKTVIEAKKTNPETTYERPEPALLDGRDSLSGGQEDDSSPGDAEHDGLGGGIGLSGTSHEHEPAPLAASKSEG